VAGAIGADVGNTTVVAPALERRQARLAFALLVSERHRLVERDEIADLLWPANLPGTWESAVRNVVTAVRLGLGQLGLDPQKALTTTFHCYQLRLPAGAEVDVETAAQALAAAEEAISSGAVAKAAEQAEAAASVLQRPFLPGETARWVEQRRADLRDRHVRALQILSDAQRSNGQPAEAVAAAEQLVELAPYDEHNHRLLINAHAATGDRRAALRAYESCRVVLSQELSVEPAAATQALYQSLLSTTPKAAVQPDDEKLPRLNQPAFATPFVGRTKELADLRAHRFDGGGRVFMIGGEAGIGKTRLALEFATTAMEPNALVLYGGATEDVAIPYQPFVEVFQTWAETAPAMMKAIVEGEGAGLVRLLPALRPSDPIGAGDEPPERQLLFASVVAALRIGAGDRPVVIILDDLHWGGQDTVALLGHLARSAHRLPGVAVIVTYRRSEPGSPPELAALLANLRRQPSVAFLDLGGIDEDSVAVLAEALVGRRLSRRTVAEVYNETSGNPFFASEVLAELSRHPTAQLVPRAVGDVVADRVRRLSPATRSVMATAAVVGITFPSSLAAGAAGISLSAFFDAVDEAAGAGLVEPMADKGSRYRFRHAIVRAAIYDGLGTGRRAILHRQVARALAGVEPKDDRVRLAALAHHWGQGAPGTTEAVDSARAAAEAAASAVAYSDAAALYGQALDHLGDLATQPLRAELLLGLGACSKRAGKRDEAEAALAEAAQVARQIQEPELLARVALTSAGPERSNPDAVHGPFALVNEALEAIASTDSPLRAALLARQAQMLSHIGDQAGTASAARTAAATARKVGDDAALAQALAASLPTMPVPAKAAERLQVAEQLASLVGGRGDAELRLLATEHLAYSRLELGDGVGARQALARYASIAESSGVSQGKWFAVQHQIMLATLEGRWAQVDRLIKQAAHVGRQAADANVVTKARTVYLTVPRWFQGRIGELAEGYADIYRLAPQLPNNAASRLFVNAHTTGGKRAAADLDAFFSSGAFSRIPMAPRWPALIFLLASSIATVGAVGAAEALYDVVLPLAELNCVYFAFVFYGAYAYHLGRLALVLDRRREALTFLQLGLQRHRDLGAAPWVTLTESVLTG
jgi:DNA-binding SARP family transcriptional activator